MASSYSSALKKLFSLHEAKESWITGEITIPVCKSLTDDDIVNINLSETLGHNKRKPRKRHDGNCYWLPKEINENNADYRKKHIHPIFGRACHSAGFIITGEYEKSSQCIVFQCNHGHYHREEYLRKFRSERPRNVKDPSKPPVPRGRKSAKPGVVDWNKNVMNDRKTCPFRFQCYWDLSVLGRR